MELRKYPLKGQTPAVGEQPGWSVFFLGLALSLVLGFSLRGVFSPHTLRARLQSAAAQIHPQVRVSFDDARIVLAEGIFPVFEVQVRGVRAESENSCWMKPELEIDRLIMPLSPSALLFGRNPVYRLKAQTAKLNFRISERQCIDVVSQHKADASVSAPPFGVSIRRDTKSAPHQQGELEEISIGELTVLHPKLGGDYIQLQDFKAQVGGGSLGGFKIRSKIIYSRLDVRSDYVRGGSLNIDYQEFPAPVVFATLYGNWREGYYSFNCRYRPEDGVITLSADLRQIPLRRVYELLRQHREIPVEVDLKRSWVSFKAEMTSSIEKFSQSDLRIHALRVEGDLGQLVVDEMSYPLGTPHLPKFDARLGSLSLDHLLGFSRTQIPTQSIQSLGRLDGFLRSSGKGRVDFLGQLKGLSFVFSSQGRREIQELPPLDSELLWENGKLSISGNAQSPGPFQGSFRAQILPEKSQLDATVEVRSLELSRRAQILITGGGKMGPIRGKTSLTIRNGGLFALDGRLDFQDVAFVDMNLKGAELTMKTQGQSVALRLRIPEMLIGSASPPAQLLQDVLREKGTVFPLKVTDFRVDSRLAPSTGTFEWSLLQGKTPNGSFQSSGGWDEKGNLQGALRWGKSWKIHGTRDKPILILSND
ncbi:MAG: hypothetical protein N2578_04180 [Bdellovibrionaceae bacterium]|nr:hypothetical protein [Pseudobdellovibrionaceae bacterium]